MWIDGSIRIMTSGGKEDKYNHPIDMDISPRAETNNTSHPQGKCALCGKQVKMESQGPRGASAGGDRDGFSSFPTHFGTESPQMKAKWFKFKMSLTPRMLSR